MKLKKQLFLLCLLFSFTFTLCPVYAISNDLSSIEMSVYLNEDGSADIIETWDIYVTEGTEFYKEMNNMSGSSIYNFSVSEGDTQFTTLSSWDINASLQEKKYKAGIMQNGDDYELCFGVGEYGQHTFTMQYTIDNFVDEYSDVYGMNYRLINQMDTMPSWFIIDIYSNLFTEETKIYAFGFEGTIYLLNENGEYYIEATNVLEDGSYGSVNYGNILSGFYGASFTSGNMKHNDRDFQNMVDEAMVDSDYIENGNDEGWLYAATFGESFITFFIIIIGVVLVLAMVVFFSKGGLGTSNSLMFTDGNNQLLKMNDVNYFRDIPCDKNLYIFYYIVVKGNLISSDDSKSGMLSAFLLSWIRDGIIQFEKKEKKGLFSKKDRFSINFSNQANFEASVEQELYEYFRVASGTNGILENKEFEKWCRKNYDKLDSWFERLLTYCEVIVKQQGYIEIHEEESKFLFFTSKRKVHLYTPEFREELYHVFGFKKFLKEFSSLNEKKVLEVMLWEDYLIFASVLGLAEQIEKEIGKLYPEFNQQSNLDIYYVTLATRSFAYSGITSASRARSAASDSSFHGGGGSSSFGGGGGSFSGGGGGGVR